MDNKLVAVYGTLKKGHGNHRLLVDSEFIGESYTAPEFTMISLGGFPAIFPKGNTSIKIEVYSVDARTMLKLDGLEGYPSFYNRKKVDTEYGKAWIYFLDRNDYPQREIIETGEWL